MGLSEREFSERYDDDDLLVCSGANLVFVFFVVVVLWFGEILSGHSREIFVRTMTVRRSGHPNARPTKQIIYHLSIHSCRRSLVDVLTICPFSLMSTILLLQRKPKETNVQKVMMRSSQWLQRVIIPDNNHDLNPLTLLLHRSQLATRYPRLLCMAIRLPRRDADESSFSTTRMEPREASIHEWLLSRVNDGW